MLKSNPFPWVKLLESTLWDHGFAAKVAKVGTPAAGTSLAVDNRQLLTSNWFGWVESRRKANSSLTLRTKKLFCTYTSSCYTQFDKSRKKQNLLLCFCLGNQFSCAQVSQTDEKKDVFNRQTSSHPSTLLGPMHKKNHSIFKVHAFWYTSRDQQHFSEIGPHLKLLSISTLAAKTVCRVS